MSKRIVICCDGTWNTPDQKDRGEIRPSNVAKMALSIAAADAQGQPQLVYYDQGVGTEWYNKLIGGMTGDGISRNICQAYAFLVDNYADGDEVFLFGFSRGAYTVRSTVGLIRNSGLLKREHKGRMAEAYKLYRRRDAKSHPNSIEADLFRKTYAREIRIRCLGVWDTVGALGIPVKHFELTNKMVDVLHGITFHDVSLSSSVENAFQALAIDERRGAFEPCVWKRQEHARGKQRLEQVWFPGVHTNVGGGYEDSGLSDYAFEWMRARAAECGLVFDLSALSRHGITIAPNWRGELRNSRTGFYKLSKEYIRPLGTNDPGNEGVHRSAVERFQAAYVDPHMKKPKPYQPVNLSDYLARPGAKIVAS
jgi:uncharacterized protein (DUF2235 family)